MKISQNKNYDGLTSHYQCTYPNGRVIESTYNNLHQAELVKSDIRGTSALETVEDYDYLYDTAGDKRPLLSKMTYDSDTLVSVDFAYDELGRSTKKAWITSAGTGSTVVGFENTYDEYGNRLTDKHLHRSVDSETYLFDSAQRFTKYERGTIGQTPGFTQGYTLDDIGNWSSFDNNGSTESRSYSSTNELTTQGTHSLAYDSNGNSLNSKTHKYIWDELNRLIEVQDNASNTIVTYYYDVHNLRVLKDFGATDEVRYYYCGNKVIEERDENEVLEREYIMGKQYVDEVLMYIDHTSGSATNYFYMTDLRFSNYAIIDGLGNVVERYKYNGYGEQIVMDSGFSVLGASVVDQFYGYTGRRLDGETGLMYFRARYYDVDQGRFINRDPLGYVDGMGLYNGYFAPRGVDPSGLIDENGWHPSRGEEGYFEFHSNEDGDLGEDSFGRSVTVGSMSMANAPLEKCCRKGVSVDNCYEIVVWAPQLNINMSNGHPGFGLPHSFENSNSGIVMGFHGSGFQTDIGLFGIGGTMTNDPIHSKWKCCCLTDEEMSKLNKLLGDARQREVTGNPNDFNGNSYSIKKNRFNGGVTATCSGAAAQFANAGGGCPSIPILSGFSPATLLTELEANKFCFMTEMGDGYFAD